MAAGRCPEALVILYARDLTLLLGQEGSRRVLLGRLVGPALRRREEAKVISHFPRVSTEASSWRSALAARAPRCARRPRHCHPSRPGSRPRLGRAPRGGPTLPLATGPGSPVTAAAGGRSRDGNAVMSPAKGGGPQRGRRSPRSGHRRAAAERRSSPGDPEARAALCQDTRMRHSARCV